MTYSVDQWRAGAPAPKGWDVADAVANGWTPDDITAFMRATARPYAPEPEPAPMPIGTEPGETCQTALPEKRTFQEILQSAREILDDDFDGMDKILAECRDLPAVRQDAIIRALKSATGIGVTALRKQMRDTSDDERGADHLEIARRSIASIGTDNIICAGQAVWMWSDDGVWRERDDRSIKQRVQGTIEAEGMSVNSTVVNGVSEVLKTEIYREDHEFNLGHPETINARNGQIVPDGDAWTLEPHCKRHYRTTQIPVEFDPDATAPRWAEFLTEVFPDPDGPQKSTALMEMMGYTLMSHARHELFALMIGSGGNGKSVVLSVLEALCGQKNIAGVQPSNFADKYQRAHLDQKLANIVTEIKQGEILADAELKGIVSGEPSTVEHKYKDPYLMSPFATCWFGTNHMPHTRDFSDALFRRALILKFNRTFTEAEKNPLLKDHLIAELPGILNMALAAYRNAATSGFTRPPSSEDAKHEWRLEADQVAMFVDDKCRRDPAGREPSAEVFAAYQKWAADNGVRQTMSAKGMRDRLTRLGFGAHRDGTGRYVTGLSLSGWGNTDTEGW